MSGVRETKNQEDRKEEKGGNWKGWRRIRPALWESQEPDLCPERIIRKALKKKEEQKKRTALIALEVQDCLTLHEGEEKPAN